MFSSKNKKHGGFTLLEVMIAVAILSIVVISIYRFVETTVAAVRISTEELKESTITTAFFNYLRAQMQALPAARNGALLGEAHRFNDISSDEITWVAAAGAGTLTRSAPGEWNVTLTTKQIKGNSYEIGLRRQDVDGKFESSWFPLFSGVNGFEVRYFDPRQQAWLEKWTDQVVRPALVRIKLWKESSSDPYEVVLPLPVASGAQPPNFTNPGGPPVNGLNPDGVNGNPNGPGRRLNNPGNPP